MEVKDKKKVVVKVNIENKRNTFTQKEINKLKNK